MKINGGLLMDEYIFKGLDVFGLMEDMAERFC